MEKDILRFLTAGSVDDGKSTLIGRLLCDSQQVYDDHFESLKRDSAKRGCQNGALDYSLLMDGLKAEREQNITIDIAHRYFSTAKRKFIILDAPGHEQYTKNMVTGASNADLLLLLVNAQNGLRPQTRRHSFIASLMGIQHVVVAVNKMDLVDYSQERFEQIKNEYLQLVASLPKHDIYFIPISASQGDGVVKPSEQMPWFKGKPLLSYLEEISLINDFNYADFRFPVQLVLRPHANFRGYAGTVASGTLKVGDQVMVLPSKRVTQVCAILDHEKTLESAGPSDAITVVLEDNLDISRGDMLTHMDHPPSVLTKLKAMLIWMDHESMGIEGQSYLLKHTTQTVPAVLSRINNKIDIHTFEKCRNESGSQEKLLSNDIACVDLFLHRPIFFDPYDKNQTTGSFILIDHLSNQTVAAGVIINQQTDVVKKQDEITKKGCVVWLTGLSGAGKTTIAHALKERLQAQGDLAYVLDGDVIRGGLSKDLGLSPQDRSEHTRRVAEVAALFADAGMIAIVALISPYIKDRLMAREAVPPGQFFEVFIDTPLEVCEQRDPKNLYKKARAGEIQNLSGIGAPYERPVHPEVTIDTVSNNVDQCISKILEFLSLNA